MNEDEERTMGNMKLRAAERRLEALGITDVASVLKTADRGQRIDMAELKKFIVSRRQLGWTDRQLMRHKYPKTWWGSRATMPVFIDNWTEAQWIGWMARSRTA